MSVVASVEDSFATWLEQSLCTVPSDVVAFAITIRPAEDRLVGCSATRPPLPWALLASRSTRSGDGAPWNLVADLW